MPRLPKDLPLDVRRIFFRGIIDLDGLFKAMRQWFLDYKYKFEERSAKHKITSDGAIKEHEWVCEKEVTENVKYHIRCRFHIRNVVGVEVIKKGEKQKLSQCHINLEITPIVIIDPYGHFEVSAWYENLRDWLSTHVIKKDILFIHADQLDYRTLKLQGVVKDYLDFATKEYAYAAKW